MVIYFLGPSESPQPINQSLEVVNKNGRYINQRQNKPYFDAFSHPALN